MITADWMLLAQYNRIHTKKIIGMYVKYTNDQSRLCARTVGAILLRVGGWSGFGGRSFDYSTVTFVKPIWTICWRLTGRSLTNGVSGKNLAKNDWALA